MYILQNLFDFMDNPMGKGSMAITSRQLIRDDLNRRLDRLLLEYKKKVRVQIYKDKDEYYFHIKIPSESEERKNDYDVVLHFTLGEDGKDFKNDRNLNRYYVRFFSNIPSFTYTYAYAFYEYGLLIDELRTKYDKIVFKNMPITRNPSEVISFEKSIYFACRYLEINTHYLDKHIIDKMASPFKVNEFKRVIRNTDKIELEIKIEDQKIKKEKERKSRQENEVSSGNRVGVRDKTSNSRGRTMGGVKPKMVTSSKITPRKSSKRKIGR